MAQPSMAMVTGATPGVRRLVAAVACCLGLVGLSACTADRAWRAWPDGLPTRAVDGCETDDGTGAELEPRITDDVPDGFEEVEDGVQVRGPVDLALLTDWVYLGSDDVLAQARFRRGYQRVWYGFEQERGDLFVEVLEFCDPTGAEGFLRWLREDLRAPEFELDDAERDPPADVAATLLDHDPSGPSALALLRHGPYVLSVSAGGGSAMESDDELVDLAIEVGRAQVAELT